MNRKPNFGEMLRAERVSRELVLSELALRIGISRAYLYQIEAGRVKRPSPEVLTAIALHYGITYEELDTATGPIKQGRKLSTPPVDNSESTE